MQIKLLAVDLLLSENVNFYLIILRKITTGKCKMEYLIYVIFGRSGTQLEFSIDLKRHNDRNELMNN